MIYIICFALGWIAILLYEVVNTEMTEYVGELKSTFLDILMIIYSIILFLWIILRLISLLSN